MIVIVAIMAVYLWGAFTNPTSGTCTQADVDKERHNCQEIADTDGDGVLDPVPIQWSGTKFFVPEQTDLEGSTLWIIKLLIIGAAIFIGYMVVTKIVGRNMGRRDVMSLVLLGVALYFVWVYFIEPSNLLGASNFGGLTLDNIGTATAQKLGLA